MELLITFAIGLVAGFVLGYFAGNRFSPGYPTVPAKTHEKLLEKIE